jgi:GTP-binding protein HflX
VAERALLVGVALSSQAGGEAEASLLELERLAGSAGAQVLGSVLQARRGPDPATYIGEGKARQLKERAEAEKIDLVIFDDELKPSQQRNLEEALGVKVLDRTQLILDVFAGRASSNEGRLQVELAQLSYLLPRLVGMGAALSRLGGGIGTRGPGETKLEADRRRLRDRISLLAGEIAEVSRTREMQRQRRRKGHAKVAALAGYTNAGKSSLFNSLTSAKVYVEDRLFATLDPTVRAMEMEQSAPMQLLLVDTVGFVRKLPHALVAAFRATLEEVADADVVLKVVDAADPGWPGHLRAVDEVLDQVYKRYLHDRPEPEPWLVFNKCDQLGPAKLKALKAAHPGSHCVSALNQDGLEALRQSLRASLEKGLPRGRYLIPHDALGKLSRHFAELRILKQEWTEKGLLLEAILSREMKALEPYRVKGTKGGR